MARATKPQLGDLERAVMDVLWSRGDLVTVREAHEALVHRAIAYTTVMTVLDRLARKGLVLQIKDGRAFRYQALCTRAELAAEIMHNALEVFTSHDRGSALTAFLDEASPNDVEALRAALRQLDA